MTPTHRKREWAPAVEAARVATPATPYDLRDTFASNPLAAGVNVFEPARVMGTSVRVIEKHYGALPGGLTHLKPSLNRRPRKTCGLPAGAT